MKSAFSKTLASPTLAALLALSLGFTDSAFSKTVNKTSCDWKAAASGGEDPATMCINSRPLIEKMANQCLDQKANPELFNRASAMARLEQLKLIYDQEMFYIGRIPPTSKFYEYAWKDLRDRWVRRGTEDPYLLQLDTDKRLGRSKCALHAKLGMDCNDQVGIDMFNVKKRQSVISANANARQYKSSPSLTRDLLKAYLTLKGAELSAKAMIKIGRIYDFRDQPGGENSVKMEEAAKEVRESLANYVFSYFPELYLNDKLKNILEELANRNGVNNAIEIEINRSEAQNKGPIGVDKKLELVRQVSTNLLSTPYWTSADDQAVEAEFTKTYQEIIGKMDGQIRHTQSNRNFTLRQDYLLGSAMSVASSNHDDQRTGIFQTMICSNAYKEENFQKWKTRATIAGGGIALMTGVGAMFDVGAAMAIGLSATSIGLINVMSVSDYINARMARSVKQELFILHATGADATSMDDANSEVSSALNWVFINAAMVAPIAILSEINTARNVAEAAGDIAKVNRLDLYHKIVVRANFAGNVALTTYSSKSGLDAVKDLIKDHRKDPAADPGQP